MAKADVFKTARELGDAVAKARATWPQLSLIAAEAARRGTITEDDAAEIYEIYIKRALGIAKVDFAAGTIRTNTSKLRAVIKCARENRDTIKTLKHLTAMHTRMRKTQAVKPLYDAMVLACRELLRQKNGLSERTLAKLIAR